MVIATPIVLLLGPTETTLYATADAIRALGPGGALVFALIYIVAALLFVPASLLTIAAGFLFGFFWGVIIVSIASNLGALAGFFLGRYVARDAVRLKVQDSPRFHALYRAVGKEAFRVIALTRLVPLIPFSIQNYAFGLTTASWQKFLAASWLGMIPGTLAFVYIGAAANTLTQALNAEGPPPWMQLGLYGMGALGILGGSWLLTRRARREFDAIVAEEAELARLSVGPPKTP